MKIEKTQKPKPVRKSVNVSGALVVDVVKEGDEFRVEKDDVVVSRVSGVFRDVCFLIDEYRICFNKSELEKLFEE